MAKDLPEKLTVQSILGVRTITTDDYCSHQMSVEVFDEIIRRCKAYNPWILTDDPPNDIDWDKKVLALECESEIPRVMTMAEIFLDEDSEAEYWKPIVLPEQALSEEKQDGSHKSKGMKRWMNL